jgi:hypothetical protein
MVMKSRRIRLAVHAENMGELSAFKTSTEKPGSKSTLVYAGTGNHPASYSKDTSDPFSEV